MFIQTEQTPNPMTLKFLPGRQVISSGGVNISGPQDAWKSPLAHQLFDITGVISLYFGQDFISVTKADDQDWAILKPQVLGTLMDYLLGHQEIEIKTDQNNDTSSNQDTNISAEDAEIIQEIKDMIETRVRPAVAQDGGDIIFRRFSEGIVYLELQGACSGCPSSTITLKNGIENMLRHYIPEVNEVRAIN